MPDDAMTYASRTAIKAWQSRQAPLDVTFKHQSLKASAARQSTHDTGQAESCQDTIELNDNASMLRRVSSMRPEDQMRLEPSI